MNFFVIRNSSAKTSRTVALDVVRALANGTTVRAVVVLLTMAEHGAIYRSKSSGISSTFWYSTTFFPAISHDILEFSARVLTQWAVSFPNALDA